MPPEPYRPRYVQVADEIAEQIRSGRWVGGDRLPAEADLQWDYRVGEGTIRRALTVLEQDGLIERTEGQRALVRPTRPTQLVQVHEGDLITVRRPTRAERERYGLAGGELLADVDTGESVTSYPSDGVVFQVRARPDS